MRVWRLVPSVLVAALVLQLVPRAAQVPADPVPCTFPAGEIAWLQRALDSWHLASREFLLIDPSPLPWIVLFDASCVWHLSPDSTLIREAQPVETPLTFAGRPVPVRALRHKGTVLLPSGVPMAVEMKASTSLYRNGRGAFFVMAMPSVWQTKDVSAPTRAEYLQGVFSHEMTHTRLLVDINRRVRELARKNDLVYPINDDVIQAEFRRTPRLRGGRQSRARPVLPRRARTGSPTGSAALTVKALETWYAPGTPGTSPGRPRPMPSSRASF